MNKIYFDAMQETDKARLTQYLAISSLKNGCADKIQLDDFIRELGLVTINTLPPTPESLIEITYADAQTAITNGELEPGVHYKITDRADEGIILLATTESTFSLEGQGIFLNADYQDVGDYSGIALISGIAYVATEGVWIPADEGVTINLGDVVFWNGTHYLTFNPAAFNGTDPRTNGAAYLELDRDITLGYIREIDFIYYDFANDTIIRREDKRGNICENSAAIEVFQWGNDSVYNNKVSNITELNCLNNQGIIEYNTLLGACVVTVPDTNTALISSNTFNGDQEYTCDFSIGSLISCDISAKVDIVFLDETYTEKIITSSYSDFSTILDMSTDFAAGSLTIPANLNYIGIFTLNNNTGQTITKIINLPESHTVRFYVQAGNSQIFSHTAVASIVNDNLVSDAAVANTIIGRANAFDFIEYEKTDRVNRRGLIVKLA